MRDIDRVEAGAGQRLGGVLVVVAVREALVGQRDQVGGVVRDSSSTARTSAPCRRGACTRSVVAVLDLVHDGEVGRRRRACGPASCAWPGPASGMMSVSSPPACVLGGALTAAAAALSAGGKVTTPLARSRWRRPRSRPSEASSRPRRQRVRGIVTVISGSPPPWARVVRLGPEPLSVRLDRQRLEHLALLAPSAGRGRAPCSPGPGTSLARPCRSPTLHDERAERLRQRRVAVEQRGRGVAHVEVGRTGGDGRVGVRRSAPRPACRRASRRPPSGRGSAAP